MVKISGSSKARYLVAACLPWLLLASSKLLGFEVKDAVSRLTEEVFVIDAEIDYAFTEVALEALENGVPLTVDVHVQVRRDGAWVWESDIVDFHHRRQLRYLPLASSYEVIDLKDSQKQTFVSRLGAIDALGVIKNYPVVKVSQLEKGETYRMEIRTELDIEALPVPLRPTAYMSSDWKLSSEWSQWRIRP